MHQCSIFRKYGGEIVSVGKTKSNLTGYSELDICIQTESARVLYPKHPKNMASRMVMVVLLFSPVTKLSNSEPQFQTVEVKEDGDGLVNYEKDLHGNYYRSTGG